MKDWGWSCLHDTYKHKSWGKHAHAVWSCCSGELYYHLVLFTNCNRTHNLGGTIDDPRNLFFLYRIINPTGVQNAFMHFQQQLACRKYFNYLSRRNYVTVSWILCPIASLPQCAFIPLAMSHQDWTFRTFNEHSCAFSPNCHDNRPPIFYKVSRVASIQLQGQYSTD